MWGGLIGVGRVRCQARGPGPGRVMDKPESEFYKLSRTQIQIKIVRHYMITLFHSNAKHLDYLYATKK